MASTNELIVILREALRDRFRRKVLIDRFQHLVWNAPAHDVDDQTREVFADLAYDLDGYEPDPEVRSEDSSFYDEQGLEQEIREALRKLCSSEV